MSETYSVVLTGKLLNDETLDNVKNNVGAAFKLSAAQLDKLFSGKPVALKRGLDKKQAVRLSTRLQQLGAHAVIKAVAAKPAKPEPVAKPSVPFTDIVASMPEPGSEMPEAKPAVEVKPEPVAKPEPIVEPVAADPKPVVEESVVAEPAAEPQVASTSDDETVAMDALAAEPAPQAESAEASDDNITCPRCGHEQAYTTACSFCKMDLTMHIKRMAKKAKVLAAAKRA